MECAMNINDALSIGDIEQLAKRRLPRVVYEGIASGVEDERGITRNETAFHRYRLLPYHLIDVSARTQSTRLFGRTHASPFGISPTGIAGIFRRDAELMLAQAAAGANVPFIMSGASMVSIERGAEIDPANTWFQIYAARDPKISDDFVRRARDAGFGTLVLTVDNPVPPKRERDSRNGFRLPPKLSPLALLEALRHPGWVFDYLRGGGMPVMETWAPYAAPGASAAEVARFFRTQSPSVQTWRDLEGFRRTWSGKLVVKGIMRPSDALRCAELGVDGIVVSNHGGKSLDRAPASIELLSPIKAAVGDRLAVMLDSGVRRGSDVVVARCLGADFVFVGRATLYGVAAAGLPGATRALDILREEIDTTLGLIGCPSFEQLGPDFLAMEPDEFRQRSGTTPQKRSTQANDGSFGVTSLHSKVGPNLKESAGRKST
jgi:isopentenyl diphosphate isomerase/L-lactate dehydrogenase-like FMN-dependent dehydrogenase